MNAVASQLYQETDPSKKDLGWANNCITLLRRDWRQIVNPLNSRNNKRFLLSMQDMDAIKDSFKDKDFKSHTSFEALGIMDNIVNTLVEEMLKSPPKAELKAVDPTAQNLRESDINLLKNRVIIEQDITAAQKSIGLPPYRVSNDSYNSNVGEFDRMGLDENDNDDINFFSDNFQRLHFEVAGQQVVNNVMKTNRFDEATTSDLVRDVLANKVACVQTYVDKITGEIKFRYIYPETAYGIWGDTTDGRDDICRGWQDNVTLLEWLQMVGNDFDFEKNWKQLLWALNTANNMKWTGFIRNNSIYNIYGFPDWANQMGLGNLQPFEQTNYLEWSLAYTYKILAGYVEWNTCEATATYLKRKDDGIVVDTVEFNYDLKKKKQITKYEKETFYQQQWYGSYFLATTQISQWLYGFGKVYYQTLYGANDEYSNGTLTYIREKGRPAVSIAIPYIKMANFAFYRLFWTVYRAKPQSEQYVMEELLEVAKSLQRQYQQAGTTSNVPSLDSIVGQYIQYQRENLINIRSYPKVDGRTVAQLPPLEEKRNGIDPIWVALQSVQMWAEMQIAAKLGMNPQRFGDNPPSRESFKSEQSSITGSYNSTGYVYRMIQYVKEHIATSTLNYSQTIVKYKDTIPYKWLQKIVGDEVFGGLSALDEFSAHRFGIFVKDFNTEYEKQRITQAADIAMNKGTLTYDQWFVVTQTEDYKLANKILQYLNLRKEKKLRAQQLQDLQIQDQMASKRFQEQLQLQQEKNKAPISAAQIQTTGHINVAEIAQETEMKKKEIAAQEDPKKLAAKTEGAKDLAATKENLKRQEPFPVAAEAQ